MKESTNRFPSPLTMKMNTSIATPHCQTESSNPKKASDGLTVNSQFLKRVPTSIQCTFPRTKLFSSRLSIYRVKATPSPSPLKEAPFHDMIRVTKKSSLWKHNHTSNITKYHKSRAGQLPLAKKSKHSPHLDQIAPVQNTTVPRRGEITIKSTSS